MKKIVLLVALAVSAIISQAATYNYLVFTNTEGTTTAFSVANLTLNVNGSNLQVKNDEGTVDLVLTNLAAMQFSEDGSVPSGFEQVLNGDEPVQVFSLSGASLGSFGSLVEAAKSLNAGVYVISNGSVTQKLVVK